jgi:hypothetical protein
MTLPKENYLLHWQEDNQSVVGEGLSRTESKAARLWSVDVGFNHQRPMKTTVRASSKSEAIKFTKNRHPLATTITVLGKA